MRNIIFNMRYFLFIMMLIFISTSCEEYLDKAPEADVTEKDAFRDFTSFQGFIEELYACVVDPDKGGAWNNYSFADENLGPNPYPFDVGNYWNASNYFTGRPNIVPSTLEGRNRRIYEWSWYALRKANLALAKIDEEGLFEGSQEEKNIIKGQALFWRGWFYFELGRFWGGLPYITRVLDPTESLITEEFSRLTFQEMAIEMAKDFRAAADLLPNHWDESEPGQITSGNNRDRVNKFQALGYLGKALLYGASPMINEEATGTNSFNGELAKQAAQAFGELLTLAEQTQIYSLQPWANYMEVFHMFSHRKTGGVEVIMNPTIYNRGRIRWSALGATVPSSFGLNSGSSADVPTHNIVKNFAMANGLPIYDPESGYNPDDPWTNLEPRFYKFIVIDGERFSNIKASERNAELYTGGRHRSVINPASVTGYYQKKFNGINPNFTVSSAGNLSAYVPFLRMADIYLMYAEAVNFSTGGGPNSTSGNFSMTAIDAVNAVRNRAQLPNLPAKYTADKDVFFEEIVRERAVELFMEGARFCDLRRWNRNGDPRYLEKTALDFLRGPDGKPINVSERVIIKRVAEAKHNWLPFPVGETKIYEGFRQNPGW